MKYDKKIIGQRIKTERIAAGFKTQGDFAKALGFASESRQTIGNWENGKVLPCLDDMMKMCTLFDCEIGYLLGEYACKTKDVSNIHSVSGLSEESINKLIKIKNSSISETIDTLSQIIHHKDFEKLLRTIHLHVFDFNNNMFRIDSTNANNIATYMNCRPSEIKNYLEASSKSLIESTISQIVSDLK